ncbi:hypothetical protein ACFWYW_59200 [Nonomuraea sp. NPDC059023]|uniref:hypothetical protein n=1 Tax=unclassified Nonomuraea TaxID=2593643 RepID=UPI00368E9EEC
MSSPDGGHECDRPEDATYSQWRCPACGQLWEPLPAEHATRPRPAPLVITTDRIILVMSAAIGVSMLSTWAPELGLDSVAVAVVGMAVLGVAVAVAYWLHRRQLRNRR